MFGKGSISIYTRNGIFTVLLGFSKEFALLHKPGAEQAVGCHVFLKWAFATPIISEHFPHDNSREHLLTAPFHPPAFVTFVYLVFCLSSLGSHRQYLHPHLFLPPSYQKATAFLFSSINRSSIFLVHPSFRRLHSHQSERTTHTQRRAWHRMPAVLLD